MICDQCMEKMNFLQAYLSYSLPSQQICTVKKGDTNENVDVEGVKNESDNKLVNGSGASSEKSDGEITKDDEVYNEEMVLNAHN